LVPRLALSGALCSIDTLMIEWHERYFLEKDALRMASELRLGRRSNGVQLLANWVQLTPKGLRDAATACGGRHGPSHGPSPRILRFDDETYLHDLQPWPSASSKHICARRSGGQEGITPQATQWLSGAWLFWRSIHDEFEDDELLGFWYGLLAFLLCVVTCCCRETWLLLKETEPVAGGGEAHEENE
jgi:hypothetical protein